MKRAVGRLAERAAAGSGRSLLRAGRGMPSGRLPARWPADANGGPQEPGACHSGRPLTALRAQQQSVVAAPPPGLTTKAWTGAAREVEALRELQEIMAASPVGLPDTETQVWFLRDRDFDAKAAADKLTRMLTWRRAFAGERIADAEVAAQAATGKAYLHSSLDVNGRPVIVVRVSSHITGEFSEEDSQKMCVWLLEKAMDSLPAGCETILGVFDLRNFSHRNADLGFVRFLVDAFFSYYPKRLGQVLMVDAPWLFQPGWNMVRPWLKKYAALVRFVTADELRAEFFTAATLPPDFREPQ